MGRNDAFAVAVIFKQMLSRSDYRSFSNEVGKLFKVLEKQLHTITVEDVQTRMGFPSTWENVKDLK